MKKAMLLPALALLLAGCTSSRFSGLALRVHELEKTTKSQQVAINHLTDKAYGGKSETIKGITFYPKAKVHKTRFGILYYRKKEGDTFYDFVLVNDDTDDYMKGKSIKIWEKGLNVKGDTTLHIRSPQKQQ